MPVVEDQFTASLDAVLASAAHLPHDVEPIVRLGDDELLAAQRILADARRAIDACSSLVAGEVKHRSRRELGYEGLAQRTGFNSPEKLIQHTTGSTARDARTLVTVGAMVHDSPSTEPWLTAVGAAVAAGGLSVNAAQAIKSGLGTPVSYAAADGAALAAVTVDDLTAAAAALIVEAVEMNADQLFQRARELRDELDELGIALRERAIHERRALRRTIRPDGSARYVIDLDLESTAWMNDLYDLMTSPRRGGPRFVADGDKAWADAVASDARTTEQYAHDSFLQLLRLGADADAASPKGTHRVLGSRQPSVRVLVTARDLTSRDGHGFLEGVATPVSIGTVERLACTNGTLPIIFDDQGNPLNLAREQRLYSGRQRVVLAARDGGCTVDGCGAPASWTEAHHTRHWKRDQGPTNVDDGILLCRFHHMLVHNNGWEIVRDDDGFWLIPPKSVDPEQQPRRMRSRSPALARLLKQNGPTLAHQI